MIKSPLNYIGGKYKLLPQILPLFPQQINHFVDLFAGGLDVSINVNARHIICNDINNYIIEMFQYFQQHQINDILNDIKAIIEHFALSKENREGYNQLRNEYNQNHSPLYLFLLICYGFNHQLRFNNKMEFNNPFGINRSSYNKNTERNLKQLVNKIQDFTFFESDFKYFDTNFMQPGDFLYADPPYLISCGTYNDGKRGFNGWSEFDDQFLFNLLDNLNQRNIRFAISNVIRHKTRENVALRIWAKQYNIHYINANYSNSNYQATARDTIEVLVTNY